mmetsp:Transcript_43194/g.113756  ORF Transcript_43194/g.113756 Transcript_43194/m.113756 type:complete len:127 (+) Transcript_43194:1025-1405(+)
MEGGPIKALAEIKERFQAEVIFAYLCEAHAVDTWPLSPEGRASHKSMKDRGEAVAEFLARFPEFDALVSAVVVDDMTDATTVANGLWPERWVVLEDGVVKWTSSLAGDQGPVGQDLLRAAQAAYDL